MISENKKEQASVIFEPKSLELDYEFVLPADTKEIFIPTSQNTILNGFLYQRTDNNYLMIYFPGNAGNLQDFLNNHSMTLDWGYDILVTDYRSFGKSTGQLSGQGQLYSDANQVYEYALRVGYRQYQIILYGYSMGTAMAAYLASTKTAKAIILESGYSSIAEISWVGERWPAYGLNTAEKASKIHIPTLIIHGELDTVIHQIMPIGSGNN